MKAIQTQCFQLLAHYKVDFDLCATNDPIDLNFSHPIALCCSDLVDLHLSDLIWLVFHDLTHLHFNYLIDPKLFLLLALYQVGFDICATILMGFCWVRFCLIYHISHIVFSISLMERSIYV